MLSRLVPCIRSQRPALRRLEAATAAYLRAPGTDTLQKLVDVCGPALHDIARRRTGRRTAARVVQQAALAYSHGYHRLGEAGLAELAADLLGTLAERAPRADQRLAGAADLATLEFTRYLDGGTIEQLERCIERYENILPACPTGSPYRPVVLGALGNALVELSRRDGGREVLDQAVARHEEALGELSPRNPYRVALLVNLATALVARWQRSGDPADLQRAGDIHAEVERFPDVDEQVLVARAEVLWERYAATDSVSASAGRGLLDEAVAILEGVVGAVPHTVPLWRTAAINLANARLELCWRFSEAIDVDSLIDAIGAVTPPGTPDGSRLRHVEGLREWQSYLTTGDLRHLATALAAWRDAAEGLPAGDTSRASLLNSVAVGILQQAAHDVRGEGAPTAHEAVAAAREAVDAAAPGSATASLALNTLAQALSLRHHRTGSFADATHAVEAWRAALATSPRRGAARACERPRGRTPRARGRGSSGGSGRRPA